MGQSRQDQACGVCCVVSCNDVLVPDRIGNDRSRNRRPRGFSSVTYGLQAIVLIIERRVVRGGGRRGDVRSEAAVGHVARANRHLKEMIEIEF